MLVGNITPHSTHFHNRRDNPITLDHGLCRLLSHYSLSALTLDAIRPASACMPPTISCWRLEATLTCETSMPDAALCVDVFSCGSLLTSICTGDGIECSASFGTTDEACCFEPGPACLTNKEPVSRENKRQLLSPDLPEVVGL